MVRYLDDRSTLYFGLSNKPKGYIWPNLSFIIMQSKPRKRRRSKGITINKETGEFAGFRKIIEVGGSYYIGVPREFVEKHNIKDDYVYIIGGDIMKIIPRKKDEDIDLKSKSISSPSARCS